MEDIRFRRGDTYKFKFKRIDSEGKLVTVKADKIWFTVKKNTKTTSKLIQKTFDDGITFDPNDSYYHVLIHGKDTKKLKYNISYPCDIQIEQSGIIKTIGYGHLIVGEEVTFEGDD